MDIALVELESAKEHKAMLKDVGFELPVIKLFKGKAKVGEPARGNTSAASVCMQVRPS